MTDDGRALGIGDRRSIKRALLAALAMTLSMLGSIADSYAQASIEPPQEFQLTDERGVSLLDGSLSVSAPTISIGPSVGGLSYTASWDSNSVGWRDNATGGIHRTAILDYPNSALNVWHVIVLGRTVLFQSIGGGAITPMEANAGTLTRTDTTWTYTAPDGAVAMFDRTATTFNPYRYDQGVITSLTRPNGEVLTFHYSTIAFTNPTRTGRRVQSLTSNLGYQLHLQYASNSANADWARVTDAVALNNTVDYCAPTANSCTFTQTWPSLTFTPVGNDMHVTDALNRTTRFIGGASGFITAVRRPSSPSANTMTYTWGSNPLINPTGVVASASDGVGTWSYAYQIPPTPPAVDVERVTTITDPFDNDTIVSSYRIDDTSSPRTYPIWRVGQVMAPGRTTAYAYNLYDDYGSYLIASVTFAEGNSVHVNYDDRGNITEVRQRPDGGASNGSDDLVTSASYPSTCSNPITCNRPSSVTDPRGYRTDFTYDSTHGGVLTATSPAPSGSTPVGSGTRPETRYAYDDFSAWYRNSSGNLVQAATPVWRLIETSTCAVSASCDGQDEETVTTTGYQAGSSSVASNVLPLTVTTAAGDGTPTATVTSAWTDLGDTASVDGPRTDVSDITAYGYDVMRQPLGELQAGSGTRPATRTTYNADGQVTNVERGSASALSSAGAFTSFTTLENTAALYNAQARKERDTYSIGGVAQLVTQYSYDAAGRLDCSAVRMNPAEFGSLPSSACTLDTAGANGPDRIAHFEYDDLGQVLTEWRAWGITTANGFPATLQQQYARYTYTANGLRRSVRDANDNRSVWVYDGFDRLCRLYFPVSTIGQNAANTGGIEEYALTCTSGGTAPDYEGYAYDANGNRTNLRLRSGESIGLSYDNLNRQSVKDIPGGTSADVYYAYDLLGRQLSARFVSTSGDGVIYSYDALSRVLSETETQTAYDRALSYQYDAAGNRTRVTYPDSNYIDYTYDVLNRMDQVRENGATSGAGLLGVYSYDLLSRPTNLAFGNGAATSLAYDTDSQDWSYTQNLASTPQDLTVSFTRNPSAQTLSRAINNALYSWPVISVGANYVPDGLNRYISVGGVVFGYDARQNLTDDGTRDYSYDLENRLTNVDAANDLALSYDPLGRLRTTNDGTTTTTFLYSGDQLLSEYEGSSLVDRYAFGAGVDRPITWYEGSALTTRNWLHADELGSVIATSDNSGVATIYSYGPYGESDATNGWTGLRFRYTGQIMLFEAQLYHYKARGYDPRLGRFLQTDPVGYEVDLNVYTYVANDPLNMSDSSGADYRGGCVGGGQPWGNMNCIPLLDSGGSGSSGGQATESDEIIVLAQRGGSRRGGARNYSPAEELRLDLHNRAMREVWRYDPGYAEARNPGSVPSNADIARVSTYGQSLAQTHAYFAQRGVSISPHALRDMVVRGARGVTPDAALRAYNSGRVFYDPSTGNYIRRDSQTGVYVVVTRPRGGEITAAMEGEIRPRWNPVPYR